MEFFVDTADINEIKRINNMGILDGVTTNPSLVAKSNKNFKQLIKEICKVVNGPVSAEVTATKFEEMYKKFSDPWNLLKNNKTENNLNYQIIYNYCEQVRFIKKKKVLI